MLLNLPLTRMQPLYIALQTEVPADKTPVHLLEQFKLENQEIERIELALRELVLNTYAIRTLKDFRRVVPSNIQNKVNEALDREEKKNPALVNPKRETPEYLIQFTDLQDLQVVFTVNLNWDSVQRLFGTKENLASEFNNISALRNAIRHSRNVDEITRLKGQAAIKWFKMQLGLS